MFSKKSISIMLIIIGVLVVFIAGLLLWRNYFAAKMAAQNPPGAQTGEAPPSSIEAGKKATEKLIEETKNLAAAPGAGNIAQVITVNRVNGDGTKTPEQAVVVAPQSNPISETTGEVLTRDGSAAVANGTRAGDADAPLQSAPIDAGKLPPSSIKLVINPDSIIPAEFTVSAGQAVVLSVNAASSVEIFKFDSPLLAAVAMGLEPRQTLVINFNAPTIIGEYVFYSDFAGHRQFGAVGKMIVQ
ncbi:MAG: hypothetical protein PHE24_05605 [Patescibacteria group bacterium]|nr:hypothetical protein [Patescibacteria group bacterium]